MKSIIVALVAGTLTGHGHAYIAPSRPIEPGIQTKIFKTVQQIPDLNTPPAQPLALASFPIAPTDTYANLYAPGNCTYYVASRKKVPNSWGNANTWADNAAAQGLTVSSIPIAGAIAQSSRGSLGHVAIVLQVNGDQVLVSEMNELGLGVVDERWVPLGTFEHYIYV